MSEHLYKLIFSRDHQGFSANEGAAFPLEEAAHFVGDGLCVKTLRSQ